MKSFLMVVVGVFLGAALILGAHPRWRTEPVPASATPPIPAVTEPVKYEIAPLFTGVSTAEFEALSRTVDTLQTALAAVEQVQGFDALMRAQAQPAVRFVKTPSGACSAVVIRPGYAISAKHCGDTKLMVVGGIPVAKAKTFGESDLLLLYAPSLKCPCARLADTGPVSGERAASIGYPYALSAPLLAVGYVQGLPQDPETSMTLWMHTAYSGPGMSGGGLFAIRDQQIVLLGITRAGKEGVLTMVTDATGLTQDDLSIK
jgi:hypothetical protein